MCIQTKPCHDKNQRPRLEQIYDPCNGPQDILEVEQDRWPTVQLEWLHVQISASDVFSRNLFAFPIHKPDNASTVRALLTTFTQHAHVPEQIPTNEGCAFTSKLHSEIMETSRVRSAHDTLEHAQTIAMIDRSHQKLKQIMKINVTSDSLQGNRYVNLVDMVVASTQHLIKHLYA